MTALALMALSGMAVAAVALTRRWRRSGLPVLVDVPMLMSACRLLRQVGDDPRHLRRDRWLAYWVRHRLLEARRRSGPDAAAVWVPRRLAHSLLDLLDGCTTAAGTFSRQQQALLALLGVLLLDSLPTYSPRRAVAPAP